MRPEQRPLGGLSVLQTGGGLAAAIAGRLLADHGAHVWILGDAAASWNLGKDRLELGDTRLSEPFDIVLAGREGFDARGDSAPIICRFAAAGPAGALTASLDDDVVAARAGLIGDQPGWSAGPSLRAHPIPSIGAALLGLQGVCAALLMRERSGRVIDVETSLLAGTLAMATRVVGDGVPSGRSWFWRANGPFPFYSAYECADGSWLQLGCLHDGFIARAIEVLTPENARESDILHRASSTDTEDVVREQYEIVARMIAREPRDHWLRAFEAADVPYAPVNSSHEFANDPQARHNLIDAGPLAVHVFNAGPVPAGAPASPVGPPDALLRGVRVLEFGNVIAGPMASRILADLGADVVKVESLGGDIARQNRSPAFYPLNSGKRGMAVDLRRAEGREIALALAARSDVVLDNMRPGSMERLGLSDDALRSVNPALVRCRISAFGSSGPYAHRPGLDPLASALAGLEMEQGEGSRPVYVQSATVDHTAAMLAAYGVLLGLLTRERQGRATLVETSLLDAAAFINRDAITADVDRPPRRSQYGPHALHRLYRASDGWLLLSAPNWEQLRRSLEWSTDAPSPLIAGGDDASDAALTQLLAETIATRERDEWVAKLTRAGLMMAAVLEGDDEDILRTAEGSDPRLVAIQRGGTGTSMRLSSRWWRLSDRATAAPSLAPELGEHTLDILHELGYPADSIDRLIQEGAVAAATGRT